MYITSGKHADDFTAFIERRLSLLILFIIFYNVCNLHVSIYKRK
jgi:hypothetical protein